MADERKKPAVLQVNTFGTAWKEVLRFDVASELGTMEVMDAAETLGRNSFDKRTRFRIVRDDPAFRGAEADAIMEWSADAGWKAVQHG